MHSSAGKMSDGRELLEQAALSYLTATRTKTQLPLFEGRHRSVANILAERAFVKKLQAGERTAFAELLHLYEPKVFRLAKRYARNEADAEDLTQDIFLAVYKSIRNFGGRSRLSTWIFRVALNHCMEYHRRMRPEAVSLDETIFLASNSLSADPERVLEADILSESILAALKQLSSSHREVVEMHELYGFTYPEIAEMLGVPVGTVKSRLFHAMKNLKTLLHCVDSEGGEDAFITTK